MLKKRSIRGIEVDCTKFYKEKHMPKLLRHISFDRTAHGNPMLKGRNWYAELQELTRDKQTELT
ncbi:MAG: hypothetical protein JO327_03550 [Nitrososphaeraceae archaeon]|nr:hypothetical protein [Nitrososphaeraceae archaeon]